MPRELTGNYAVFVSSDVFDQYPQFAIEIARCMHLWSEIEHALADLVYSSAKAPPAVAVKDYFSVFTSAQRLNHVDSALEGSEFQEELAALRPEITKLAAERAKIAHGRWGYRPDKRDQIILFPHAGERYFKGKESSAWKVSDFRDLALRLQIVGRRLSNLDSRFIDSQKT